MKISFSPNWKLINYTGPYGNFTPSLSIKNTELFLGFPPHKKGRQTFFKELAESKYTVVIYESPHRILKTLAQLPPERQIFVARELTKKFESHYLGTPAELAEKYGSELERGELVLVIPAD